MHYLPPTPPGLVPALLRGEPTPLPEPIAPYRPAHVLHRALPVWQADAPKREAEAARHHGRLRLEALHEVTAADALLQATADAEAQATGAPPSDDHPRASAEVAGADSVASTGLQSDSE